MAYSGYNTRFFFRFESQSGREFRIDIKKNGYTGTAVQRPLGQSPVLKRESGDSGIYGTSLEIYAECHTDGEFAELYTSDAREFLVVLSEVVGGTTTALWHGFVTPELYAEPEVAPPYDVQIVATDGLGELKLYDFPASGRATLYAHLYNLLSLTGLDVGPAEIVVIDSLAVTTPSVSASSLLTSVTVDLDFLAGEETAYEALAKILETLHLSITRHGDKWLLYRESDVSINSSSVAARTVGGVSVSLPAAQYGSMLTKAWWPVGRMETSVEPAKNMQVVYYAFRKRESMLTNPNLPDGTGWTYPTLQPGTTNYVSWVNIAGGSRPFFHTLTGGSATMYQDLAVEGHPGSLTLRILTMNFVSDAMTLGSKYRVYFRLKLTAASETYFLKVSSGSVEWVTSATENDFEESMLIGFSRSDQISIEAFNTTEIPIPGLPADGTLRIEITSKTRLLQSVDGEFFLGGVFLLQNDVPGFKDVISIDNDARGAAGEIECVFGDCPTAANALLNFENITVASGSLTSAWSTANFAGELLSVIAMDYALGVSLPRLRARGKLNVPLSSSIPLFFANPDGITMFAETASWKMKEDDIEVELLSLPAAEMEIVSEAISQMTSEEASSWGGSSESSGGGGSSPSSSGGDSRYFGPVYDSVTGEFTGAKAMQDLYIIQTPADEGQQQEEVTKNITDILKHLSLQVVDEGEVTERLVLVSDISLGSELSVFAGGIADGGGGGGAGSLYQLNDVSVSTRQTGDTLVYNATTSHWENKAFKLANLGDVAIGTPTDGQALVWDETLGKWKPGTVSGGGGIGSIALSMPTGFSVSGSPLTANGTITVSFATGYSLFTASLLTGYATQTWVGQQGYITSSALSGYATETWVTNKGYATETWVTNKGYITSSALTGYATQTWVGQQGYITSSALSGYATETWVTNKGYLTTAVTKLNDLTGAVTIAAGSDINVTKSGSTITIANTYSYSHPTGGANTTISAANGKVLSAITVNNLGHVTSVSSKTLAVADIPDLSGTYLPLTGGTLSGNLTIGSTSSGKTLTLYGTTSAALTIHGGSSYSTNIYRNSSGLQISSAVATGGNLSVTGNITASGSITAGSASDRRLKQDIRSITLTEAADVLSLLNPVVYHWNDEAAKLGGLRGIARGFLADEYLDILPNSGRKIWGDYDAIDYNQVIPYIVAGWQQQNLRIRILEGEISELKADNELMRRRLREAHVIQ